MQFSDNHVRIDGYDLIEIAGFDVTCSAAEIVVARETISRLAAARIVNVLMMWLLGWQELAGILWGRSQAFPTVP